MNLNNTKRYTLIAIAKTCYYLAQGLAAIACLLDDFHMYLTKFSTRYES